MRGRIADRDPPWKRTRFDESQEDSEDKVKRAVQEQEQVLVRVVEEWRSQVRRIEGLCLDFQAQLASAQKKLSMAEDELACLRRHPSRKSSGGSNADLKGNGDFKFKSEPDCDRFTKVPTVDAVTFPTKPLLSRSGSGQDFKSGPKARIASDIRSSTMTSTFRGDTHVPETFSRESMTGEAANVKSERQCSPETKANKSGSGQDFKSGPKARIASDTRSTTTTSTFRGDTYVPETFSREPMTCEAANVKSESHCSPETRANKSGCGQEFKSEPKARIASDTRSSTMTSTFRGDTDLPKTFSRKPTTGEAGANVKSEPQSSPETKANKSGWNKVTDADLALCVNGSKAPSYIKVLQPIYFPSQHKRKLKSLAMSPTSDHMCMTSALDGLINIWQIQGKGDGLSLVSSVDCLSPGQRRWPEDIAWHPSGESLLACYSADGNDNQVAVISSLSKGKIQFLEDKPHGKGIINTIVHIPWYEDNLFVTGGCDHAVVLWRNWKPTILHRSLHSSAVMGVAGIQHKKLMLSVGVDKRIIGFDTQYSRLEFCQTLDSKALGLLPNPVDLNLYMIHTGKPGQQLRLFDLRMRKSELHSFGWRQESSEIQSALINQTWSPDGLYIASGSTDPKVHIFDIRYISKEPSQSIKAHQKRVFKAAWHYTLPLLISISSDLNIGLLRLSL